MVSVQRTTYRTDPHYAHVNLTVLEDVKWHKSVGYLVMKTPVDKATKDDPYVLWHPTMYGTSVIYEEG